MTPNPSQRTEDLICRCGASLDRGKIIKVLRFFGWAACCRCGAEFSIVPPLRANTIPGPLNAPVPPKNREASL